MKICLISHLKNWLSIKLIVGLSFGIALGIFYENINKKSKLDHYYFNRFKFVKEGLMFGSSIDSKKELEDYEDQTELYMHLDGYNGEEILEMRCKALIEVGSKKRPIEI